MNTILVTAGVVALMAAVIGGGLKAFDFELPVLSSRRVRVALGALGIAFLAAAVLLADDADSGNRGAARRQQEVHARREQEAQARHEREVQARRKQEAQARHEREIEARYQRQVAATCNAVRRANSNVSIVPGPGQNIDRDATLAGVRDSFAVATRRLQLLFDKSAPTALRHKAKVARGRAESYIRQGRDFFEALGAKLPPYPTLEQFRAAGAPTSRTTDVIARLESAMTELADRDCSL